MHKVRGLSKYLPKITLTSVTLKLNRTKRVVIHRILRSWTFPSATCVSSTLLRLIVPLSVVYLLSTSSPFSFHQTLVIIDYPMRSFIFRPSIYPSASDLRRSPHLTRPRRIPIFAKRLSSCSAQSLAPYNWRFDFVQSTSTCVSSKASRIEVEHRQ